MLDHIVKYNIVYGISVLIGLLSNLAIVWIYSVGDVVDVYFSSIMLTTVFSAVFLDFLNKSFMTSIMRVRTESAGLVDGFITTVVTYTGLFFSILAICLILVSPVIVNTLLPGYPIDKKAAVLHNMVLTVPATVFLALSSLHECLWQERNNFGRVALATGARPLTMLICIVLFHELLGEVALPVGFLLGSMAAFITVAVGSGYRYRLNSIKLTEEVRSVLLRTTILSGSGFLSRLRPVIEQFFGSSLEGGSVAALSLASKFIQPLYQGALRGVRLVTFTKGADAVSRSKDTEHFNNLFQVSSAAIAVIMVPLCLWIVVNSNAIAALILINGSQDGYLILGGALMGLAPTIVTEGINRNLMGAQYARERIAFISTLGPIATGSMLIFSMVLVDDYGVLGLALSGTLASTLSLMINLFALSWAFKVINFRLFLSDLLQYLLFASVCCLIAFYFFSAIDNVLVELFLSFITMASLYIVALVASGNLLFFMLINKIKSRFFKSKNHQW